MHYSSNFLSIGGRICSVGNTYRPIHDITHSEHKLDMYSIENNRRDFSELQTFLFTVILSHYYRVFSVADSSSCLAVSIIGIHFGKRDGKRNKTTSHVQYHSCEKFYLHFVLARNRQYKV